MSHTIWSAVRTCVIAAMLYLGRLELVSAQDLGALGEAEPVTVSGTLSVQGTHYHSSLGNATGRPDATGYLSFNPTVSIYGVQFPFSVYLTTSEATFRQPFNEFGVSPRYKSLTAHLGYRSVQYSRYTLGYQRWLGAGLDVQTGMLRAAGMYGRFQAATEEDAGRRLPGIYRRMGMAFKLGIGSEQDFLDVQFLRGWDDSTSIGTRSIGLTPTAAENTVVGVAGRYGLLENRLQFDAEVAGSAFTRDIASRELPTSDVPGFVRGLMRANLSTRFNLALRGAVSYRAQDYRITVQYERIEPDYQSMGVGYSAGDREDITIMPSVSLLRTLRFNSSIGIRRNNLMNDRATTTRRLLLSFGGSWQASEALGLTGQYTNYSTNTDDGRVRVTDSIRVENVSQMISVGPRFTFGEGRDRASISLNATHQRYDDRNLLTNALNNTESTTGMGSYNGVVAEYSLNASASYGVTRSSAFSNTMMMLSVGGGRNFFDEALMVNVLLSFSRVRSALTTDSQIFPAITLTYRLSDNDLFTFNSRVSHNARTNDPYTEIMSSAGYSRTF